MRAIADATVVHLDAWREVCAELGWLAVSPRHLDLKGASIAHQVAVAEKRAADLTRWRNRDAGLAQERRARHLLCRRVLVPCDEGLQLLVADQFIAIARRQAPELHDTVVTIAQLLPAAHQGLR